VASTFAWLDQSEKQRRKVLEAIDLFREQGTRDELGISTIRDAFADLLFPGTGSLQTRARYFFFVPWMYQYLEQRRVPSAEVLKCTRAFEIALINALADSDDPSGTIGIQSRAALQRFPSSIYWSGLGRVKIRNYPGSQDEYHRSLDGYYRGRLVVVRNDDGEPVTGRGANWHHGIPSVAPGLPDKASFGLTQLEAEYLRERVLTQAPGTFLAFLFDRHIDPGDARFAWDHPVTGQLPQQLARMLLHARNFSESIHGAAILYNVMLADLGKREELRTKYREMAAQWKADMGQAADRLASWDRAEFWRIVTEDGRNRVSPRTRQFVEAWLEVALPAGNARAIVDSADAQELIHARERALKGPLARLDNPKALDNWGGWSGLGRIDFRWSNAQIIVRDVLAGLG